MLPIWVGIRRVWRQINNSVGNSPSSPRGWRERPPCSRPPVRCPSASSGARRDHARISLAAARADCPTCVHRPGSGRATRCWRGCPAVPALRQLSHVVDRRGLQRAIAGTDGDVVGLNAAPGHAQLLQRRRVDECATRRCCLPAVGLLAHKPQRSRPDQQALGGDHTVGVRGSSRGVRTSSGGPGMERIVGIATEHRIESGRCRRREPAPHIIRRWTGRPSS